MSLQQTEVLVKELELELLELRKKAEKTQDDTNRITQIEQEREQLMRTAYSNLTAYDRVYLARKKDRPNVREYIEAIFDEFYEMHGDRLFGDDKAIVGGVASLEGMPVTVIGTKKGKNIEENMECRFGMPNPEGYRKALRLMKQAEKFARPIVTFIDTSGAYPGLEAEERGQGEAIATNLIEMSQLKVPIIAIVIGEGGSGGALALSVADQIWMLENAVYSILSPEGFASILYKDASRAQEASEMMKLTANSLLELGVIERIIKESVGGISRNKYWVFSQIKELLIREFSDLKKLRKENLVNKRYQKFRKIGMLAE